VTTLDDSVLRRIASWGTGTVATSVYLDVDGQRHPRWSDVERRADQLFRAARKQARLLAASGTEAEVEAELAEMRTWLDRGLDRSATRGVALFSRAGKGLFGAVQLTVPVRDQVVVDPEPDDGGRPMGMVSLNDVFDYLAQETESLALAAHAHRGPQL
jgi:hypothetical protein